MYRIDRNGRLRICGRRLISDPDGEWVCYGEPGHSGRHGLSGCEIEWLMPKEEYARFVEGTHAKLSE